MNRKMSISELLQDQKTVKLKSKLFKKSFKIYGKGKNKDVYVLKGDSYKTTIIELTKPIRIKNCTLVLENVRIRAKNTEVFDATNSIIHLTSCVRLEGKYSNGSYSFLRLRNSTLFNHCKVKIAIEANVNSLIVQDCVGSDVYNMYSVTIVNAKNLPILKFIKTDSKAAIGYSSIILANADQCKFGKVCMFELHDNAMAEVTFFSILRGISFGDVRGDELKIANRDEGLKLGTIDNLVKDKFASN